MGKTSTFDALMEKSVRPYKWIHREIQSLDPEVDAARIIQLYFSRILPGSAMLNNLIYTLGLVRLCASREQAIPVHRGGRGKVYSRGDQRADETNFHLFMWVDRDLSDPATQDSLTHVKHVHEMIARKWPMRQQAFVHALASFTLFIENFQTKVLGLAPLGEIERKALLFQFQGIGRALGISPIPRTWRDMHAYLDEYESSEQVGYSGEGAAVAEALICQFTERWLPPRQRAIGRWIIISLLEKHIATALRLPLPPMGVARVTRVTVRFAMLLKRWVLPDPTELVRLSQVTAVHQKSQIPRCPVSH